MRDVLIHADLAPIHTAARVATYDGEIADDVLARTEFFVPHYMGPVEGLDVMRRMPRLSVCQLVTAGFDHALPYLPSGVTLCNAGGVHDASTAELAVALALSSLRGLDDAARDMASGTWDSRRRSALADRHVLIIGAGGVGQAIRRRMEPFEVTISMVARHARSDVHGMADLAALLPTADVVVLAVPLDQTTEGMVDAAFLASMRDGALLVNVARGKVVDTDALVDALATERIRAALDVTFPEPLPADHPLWQQPGVLISPHVGGNTSAFLPRARTLLERQITAWLAGDELASVVISPS